MSLSVDIEKRLGNFHLKVKFDTENEVLALFGASGCGKSMTLRCIAGIQKPDRGRIVLNGKVLFDSEKRINLSPQKRRVGYLFQQYALFPNMTVEQNIACGIHKQKDPAKVAEIIRSVHLDGMEKKHPDQLSGGQQQRTALARILIGEPDILMLDEPFSALDTHLRYQMENEVRQLIKGFGKPVILVSHDGDEVYRLSNRVAIMKSGRIETMSDKRSVFLNPGSINGAILTGHTNISKIKILGPRRVYAEDWKCEFDVGGDTCGAEYIAVRTGSFKVKGVSAGDAARRENSAGESPEGESSNTLKCVVREVIVNAFSRVLKVSPENADEDTVFMIHYDEEAPIEPGEDIDVWVCPEEIALIKETVSGEERSG